MRDLFDDFMDELRRREAAARGEDPGPARPPRGDPDPDRDPEDSGDAADRDDPIVDADADDGVELDPDGDDDPDTDTFGRPRSIDDRRRSGGRRPPPRRPGGPNDGGPGRAARTGRRLGLWAIVLAVIAIFLLFSVGIDLWTDALWFQSVGFDSVFWTRVVATLGLGVAAFLVAAAVLLGNLWLAARLAPPPSAGGPGSLRSLVDRINDAAQSADDRRGGQVFGGRDRFGTSQAITFEVGDMPDLTPLAGWVLGGIALFIALLIGGAVSGAWETVLLYLHRVPFSPTSTVTDPIFGRDVGFFLFELPFLRLVQGLFNGI